MCSVLAKFIKHVLQFPSAKNEGSEGGRLPRSAQSDEKWPPYALKTPQFMPIFTI